MSSCIDDYAQLIVAGGFLIPNIRDLLKEKILKLSNEDVCKLLAATNMDGYYNQDRSEFLLFILDNFSLFDTLQYCRNMTDKKLLNPKIIKMLTEYNPLYNLELLDVIYNLDDHIPILHMYFRKVDKIHHKKLFKWVLLTVSPVRYTSNKKLFDEYITNLMWDIDYELACKVINRFVEKYIPRNGWKARIAENLIIFGLYYYDKEKIDSYDCVEIIRLAYSTESLIIRAKLKELLKELINDEFRQKVPKIIIRDYGTINLAFMGYMLDFNIYDILTKEFLITYLSNHHVYEKGNVIIQYIVDNMMHYLFDIYDTKARYLENKCYDGLQVITQA